jgi:hypothetical protein
MVRHPIHRDDTFTYTILVSGSNTAMTYAVSGDDNHVALQYGVVNGPFGPFPIAGGDLSITLTDNSDATMSVDRYRSECTADLF